MKSINHDSTTGHVTGESQFICDLPGGEELLCGAVVYSPLAHARILGIDVTAAAESPGVRCILTADDIPGMNQLGPVIHDEPCLAEKEVIFAGQAVALVAAVNEDTARLAAGRVIVSYEPLPAITDLETAMEKGDLIAPVRVISRGEADNALKSAPHRFEGRFRSGAQEHWYLETQSAMAVPGEDNEMRIHASSQNPAETQAIVAEVLGIRKNLVEVEVRRIGGGFGGKETQGNHVAAWAALLASATRTAVRIRLFRDDDQIITGKRHRFVSDYEIGFDDEGYILAYKAELNADAGSATDLSRAILERAMLHADNSYHIPAVSITGRAWKTNLPSNTAFRGFGGPQGMAVIENAIDRIALCLGMDAAEVRRRNFYASGGTDLAPYGQKVVNCRLHDIYDRLTVSSAYYERKEETRQFNRAHEFEKRGIALSPVKFGISFTTSFLNQAGALVNIYNDGTVLVNHGGTEMGQGLHTKILQIAAAELGVTHDSIRVNATNTSKVPNTSPTAASSGSDLNGMAVKEAVDILKERLKPLAARLLEEKGAGGLVNPEDVVFSNEKVSVRQNQQIFIPFPELCRQAHLNQVSLSATGYYKTPGLWFDREKGHGSPFYYYACGMAVSEVKIDLLTGDCSLIRCDILHDCGDSINPAIDMGQIAGGFIQGVGWCTTEEIKWDRNGRLLTHSPDTYKIPTIADLPKEFNITLLSDGPNPGTIRGSKAVGEPPFMLALSAWLAIRDALASVSDFRQDPGIAIPATGEEILLAAERLKQG